MLGITDFRLIDYGCTDSCCMTSDDNGMKETCQRKTIFRGGPGNDGNLNDGIIDKAQKPILTPN